LARQLRVLGPPEILDGDGKPVSLSLGKPLALLIYVACNPSTISRDQLAELLWPEAGRQKGRHSVRQALWVLRNAFGEDLFESHDPLSLKNGVLELDLHLFLQDLSEGRVDDARDRWRGPVLEHLLLAGVRSWNHWADELRGDLEHRFCRALLSHAQALAETGEAAGAISALDQAVEISPSSEAYHLARIELLLDILRLDAARQALSEAHGCLGDHAESAGRLAALEERLDQILLEQRSRVGEGESFPMEFVGRSRELAGLHALWREADAALTRIAVITGPSGIGKTRLAQELLSYVSSDETRAVGMKGARAEMKLRWGAASDFVRQLLRLPGSAGISPASDSLLRTMLPSMGRGEVNLQTVNGVSPAAILDAVMDLLESITFEAPLVVLADDAQWMDPDSRTLFIGLVNRCRELRIFFLILGRSDLSSRHWEGVETSLVEEAGARRFLLAPLIEEEVGELLALGAAFPDPADAAGVVAKIHRASAGNPLFIREILKELHEKGILRREESGWAFHTSVTPDEFHLPENIRFLLRERLDRLSEPASSLAATLAKEDHKSSAETLRKATQLPPNIFTGAVAELLERGVIEWVDGSSLDFVHDLLRDTATTHLAASLPDPPAQLRWLKKHQGMLALMGVLIALPLGILWGRGAFPWEMDQEPPPYGGGTLVFVGGEDSPPAVRILKGPLEEWARVRLVPAPPPGGFIPFRGPGEGLIWFGADEKEDGPDMVRILQDGTRIPLFHGPGDQAVQDISPGGTRILFTSENVGRERFSHSLYWADLSFPEAKHLVYEGSGSVGSGRWSPDGDLVAFGIGAASDSLAVYSLRGERIWTRAFGEINRIEWCGGSILLVASPDGQPVLFGVDFRSEEVTPLAQMVLARGLTCSPDGKAIIQTEIVEGHPATILRDLETEEVHRFPTWELHSFEPYWIPDRVARVPVAVRAQGDTFHIEWGEKRKLAASLIFSDGSKSSEGIHWESLDPDVATVSGDQELIGNGAGVARILAGWRRSLRDTVVVMVEEAGSGGATIDLMERWTTLDTTRWIPFGSHPPVVTTVEGESVLQLKGDEKYSDGLLLQEALLLDQGITVEYEFKMELNRDVHQHVTLCLRDTDPARIDRGRGAYEGLGEAICFLYPSREFDRMDPSEATLQATPGVETRVKLPGALPTSEWTHVAIQVRADGEASLVVNHERVATSPVLLHTSPRYQWTVSIDGDAMGTELLVKNLNIWLEVRY